MVGVSLEWSGSVNESAAAFCGFLGPENLGSLLAVLGAEGGGWGGGAGEGLEDSGDVLGVC